MNVTDRVRPALAGFEPYDPAFSPCRINLSANENTHGMPEAFMAAVHEAMVATPLNRYPDPMANALREALASWHGVTTRNVCVGNGGDELLFNIALAWGGPGRTFLNMPPTFSVYVNNAQLTNTSIINVPRRADFKVDEDAVVERLAQGDIDYTIVTSPNNPTGDTVSDLLAKRMLEASDTLVMVDEAYFEFSRFTVRPLLEQFENLVILRTFSKAFSLAGVRLGYLLGSEAALREIKKVRQPYSVDAVSQAIGRVIYENRAQFEPGIDAIIDERARVIEALNALPGITAFDSQANYVLFRFDSSIDAGQVWQRLFDGGVLVRDFSRAKDLENCLRVSIGTEAENTRFLDTLKQVVVG